MLKSFYYLIRYFPFYLKLFNAFKRTKKYTSSLIAEIESQVPNWRGVVGKDNQKRMRDYILIQTMWTAGFCLLRGKRITDKELIAAANISALAPFYDDFFDKKDEVLSDLEAIVSSPFEYAPASDLEKVCLVFSRNIHNNVSDINLSLIDAKRVFKAQFESKKLQNGNLTKEQVKEIAFEKGAATVVCMSNLLDEKLSEQEEAMMGQLGGVAQFLDDVFDLREDYLEGRQTLMNPVSGIEERQKAFKKEISVFKQMLEELNYSESNKKAFMFPLTFILGAALLCLDRYKRLESKTNGIFKIEEYTRGELVLDMDKWNNRFKALSISSKL